MGLLNITSGVVVVFVSFLFFAQPASASKVLVDSINQKVVQIEKNIKANKYDRYDFSYVGEHEAAPPHYRVYFNGDKLVAVHVMVGHESWGYNFKYYYDDQQRIMKYLRILVGRPDEKQRRVAIIYNPAGKIAWKNINRPHADPNELKKMVQTFIKLTGQLSGY